jgi:hypothetical protein
MNQTHSVTPLNFNKGESANIMTKSYSDGMAILNSLDRSDDYVDSEPLSPLEYDRMISVVDRDSIGSRVISQVTESTGSKVKPVKQTQRTDEKQTVVYIERPCTCSKDIKVDHVHHESGESAESVIVVKDNFKLSGETTVLIEGAKTVTITLPENIPQQKGTSDYGIEGQRARQVTIRGLDSSTNHIIKSYKNHKIGQYDSYRLTAGKTVSFIGFGDSWYPC